MRINSIQSYNSYNKPILKNNFNNNQTSFKGVGNDGLDSFPEFNNEDGSKWDTIQRNQSACIENNNGKTWSDILIKLKSKHPINANTPGINDFSEKDRINLEALEAKLERLAKKEAEEKDTEL